ncbi:MAG: HEAT repeat domain-containing protein [Cystobacter sp.]
MRHAVVRCPLSLLSMLLCMASSTALAQVDARTASLSRQLGQGADAEARSRAASGLGSSDDPEALQPLCEGLKDTSEQVREASAQALGVLKEVAGLECLKARKGEPDSAARSAIQASLKTLQSLKEQPPKVYVQLVDVKDRTGQLTRELVRSTEARMRRKLAQMGAWLAPVKENKAAAQGVLRKYGVRGYRLQAEIHETESGGLQVTMACISYPDQTLLGDVDLQAGGAKPEDLLKALAPRIIEDAADTFEWEL